MKDAPPLPGTSRARQVLPGILAVSVLAACATWFSTLDALVALRLSPLIVGILLGAIVANVAGGRLPSAWAEGITFSAKSILRLAIILYGFRITFGQVATMGGAGLALDTIMVASTLILGTLVGTRVLGLDRQTAILTASGAAICGAAAVIATGPVIHAERHKTTVAIGTVVLFGTLAMFLYPLAYHSGLVPMTEDVFGIYIGATVHEVAHVVGAGDSVSGATANMAVIVKMTRVMMLAPVLLILGWLFRPGAPDATADGGGSVTVPWFAFGFIAVAGFNSFELLPRALVENIQAFDTFLLTVAMTALGLGTLLGELKSLGWAPMILAATLFAWLVVGGYGLTTLLVGS